MILPQDYNEKIVEIIKDICNTSIYDEYEKNMEDILSKSVVPLKDITSYLNNVTSIMNKISTPIPDYTKEIYSYVSSLNNVMKNLSLVYNNLNFATDKDDKYITDGNNNIRLSQSKDILVLKNMFEDVSFEDCATFINYMSNYPMLSYKNSIGKRIYSLIKSKNMIEYNNIHTFRVRKHECNKIIPYTDNEMFEAPYKMTQQNRFSSTGQNYLYTSDSLSTAVKEVGIALEDKYTWIELELVNKMHMLDIRDKSIPIFNYCHVPSEDKAKRLSTEYLLPNYIADCAKEIGFEGIIYYSVIVDTSINYVFFGAGKRDFRIIQKKKYDLTHASTR